MIVKTVLVFAFEVLTLSKSEFKKLGSCFVDIVSRALKTPRLGNETWIDWRSRTLRNAKKQIIKNRILLPSQAIAKQKWRMARRLAKDPGTSEIRRAFEYRPLFWWRNASDWSWRQRPSHERSGFRRRWEQSIQDYVSGSGRGWWLSEASGLGDWWESQSLKYSLSAGS